MDPFMQIAVGHRLGQAERAQSRSSAIAWKWKRYAEDLEEELEEAKRRIAQLEAHAAGITAQVLALVEAHPNSPLRENSNVVWKDKARKGMPKKKLVLIYEKAHDQRAREMGIKDPVRIRKD